MPKKLKASSFLQILNRPWTESDYYHHHSVKATKSKGTLKLHYGYPIYFEDEDTSAKLLDTIFHVNKKTWATPQLMKAFLDAIEIACHTRFNNNAQGVYCPRGQPMIVDWKKKKYTAGNPK